MISLRRISTIVFLISFSSVVVAQNQTQNRTVYKLDGMSTSDGLNGVPVSQRDLATTADELSHLIAEAVSNVNVPSGQKYRIAVFKFGDDSWNIPLELGNPPSFLQGAVVDGLQSLLANDSQKFTVLLPDQLDLVLGTGTNDPQGLSGVDLTLARSLMSAYNLDICVFGRFMINQASGDLIPVKAIVVTSSTEKDIESSIGKNDLGSIDNKPDGPLSGRFGVSFQVKPDDNSDGNQDSSWVDVKLKRKQAPTTENLFFLVIKDEWKGKRYRIKIHNKGTPAIGDDPNDADRVFGVSVFIDGISHNFRNRQTNPMGAPQWGPQTGHPLDMPKEILTKPGRYMRKDEMYEDDRFKGGELKNGNYDHDKRTIVGFQKGTDIAAAFRFGEPTNAAAAELVGPVSKLGTIQVFFYPELLPDDGYAAETVSQYTKIGTRPGEDLPSQRFKMKVKKWFPLPAETWNIVYRYEGDPSIPPPPLEDYP